MTASAGRLPRFAVTVAAALCAVAAGAVPAGVRSAAVPLFVESSEASGLIFTHVNGAAGDYYLPEEMGAGVALFDYDNDGDLDVFLVQGGALVPPGSKAGWASHRSRLFRNDLSPGTARPAARFTEVTAQAHLDTISYGMGAATGDYDGDGDIDLVVTSFGPEVLYRNNGDGTFTDVTSAAGVSDEHWSTSAAFVDYDRDGHLDLFVANYVDFTIAGNRRCFDPLGARDYCAPRVYRPAPDRLYRNLGNGTFADVTESAGISKADGAGLGVATGDYNGDGWPDLFVANDATPNQLWINQRNGRFVDEGVISGTAFNAAGNPEGSMGIASGDYDLDGDEDLFVTNLVGETFALYQNDGKGNFVDVRTAGGLAAATASFTGFGTDWFDYDNDGRLDLFVANGAVNTIASQRGRPRPFAMTNQVFHNVDGRRFAETTAAAGPAFAHADVGRGAAFGDIDNDGDIDVVVSNNGGPVRLLVNQGTAGRHWLQVRLEQATANRFAVGALVGVERAGTPTIWRRVRTDGSYLSASDLRVHFGLGSAAAIQAVVVAWPDGRRERRTDIAADRILTLKHANRD